MGKKSRLKKERKQNNFGIELPGWPKGQPSLTRLMERFAGDGQTLMTIERVDGQFVVRGEADARESYFAQVEAEFEHDDPGKLDELDALGKAMGLSLMEAKVTIFERSTGAESKEDLLMAAFLLDRPQIFEWVAMKSPRASIAHPTYSKSAASILGLLDDAPPGTPKFRMCTHLAKGLLTMARMVGKFDVLLSTHIWTQGPRGRAIVTDFKARIEAERERSELNEMLACEALHESVNPEPIASGLLWAPTGPLRM